MFNLNKIIATVNIIIMCMLTFLSLQAAEDEGLRITFLSNISGIAYDVPLIADSCIDEPRYAYIKRIKSHNIQPTIDDYLKILKSNQELSEIDSQNYNYGSAVIQITPRAPELTLKTIVNRELFELLNVKQIIINFYFKKNYTISTNHEKSNSSHW